MVLSFDDFELQLNHVLQHLYDPSLHQVEPFWQVLGLLPENGLDVLQTAIIQAVEDLRPSDHVPKTTRSWRMYGILYYRFISNLTQDEVASRLSITTRHLRREQTRAVQILALKFWENAHLPLSEKHQKEMESEEPFVESVETYQETPAIPDQQLQNDLMALQESAPGIISDVNLVIQSVISLGQRISSYKKIQINLAAPFLQLKAAIHPSALRQVLWMIVRQAVEHPGIEKISIMCKQANRKAYIDLCFTPLFAHDELRMQKITEILEAENGALHISSQAGQLVFEIELVNVDRTVLVVDDNPDIVHLYQRYLIGTSYHLVHLAKGLEMTTSILENRPDIIILDIMLPDVDGWDLLTRLTENPDTQAIPVIICSVVNDPDLATALGARLALTKPVQRQQFIESLDQVASRT